MTKRERISNGKKTVSSANGVWKTGPTRMNLDHCLTPSTEVNSKGMKDLNARQEATKILKEKTGHNLFDLGHGNFLLGISLEARETKAKRNCWDLIEMKTSAQQGKQSAKLKGN